MENLKIGSYLRTTNDSVGIEPGKIGKIVEISEGKKNLGIFVKFFGDEEGFTYNFKPQFENIENLKISEDIAGIIFEGDLVNGFPVMDVDVDKRSSEIIIILDHHIIDTEGDLDDYPKYIRHKIKCADIETVVTKESLARNTLTLK